jgi:uncharacterized damage-inducible protein DinB
MSPILTPGYARAMAAYNAEMNQRLYAAAGRLTDEVRKADRGAFWSSIHATFNHILWADLLWLARFEDRPAPAISMAQSTAMFEDFDALQDARAEMDAAILAWASALQDDWLAGDLVWFSVVAQREMRAPRSLLVAHLFNHQTHHRGQAHALITAAGESTGDTDLPFVLSREVVAAAMAG